MNDRDTIAELREKVLQLEELMAPSDVAYPLNWHLTITEALLLSCLAAGSEGYRTKAQLMYVLTEHSRHDDVCDATLSTFIMKLRKKLSPWNIYIETRWGLGFQLTTSSLTALRALHTASKAAIKNLAKR